MNNQQTNSRFPTIRSGDNVTQHLESQLLTSNVVQNQFGQANRFQGGTQTTTTTETTVTSNTQGNARGGTSYVQSGSTRVQGGSTRVQSGTTRVQGGSTRVQSGTTQVQSSTTQVQSGTTQVQTGTAPVQGGVRSGGRVGSRMEKQEDGTVIIIEEVPVFQEKIVEVPYDVIIERPVEKRIENRYYVDRVIEVEVEKIINVEKIIEVRQEKIIEVEKFIDEEEVVENMVEVPFEVERVVEVPYDVYQDKIVEKNVEILKVRPHRTEVRENLIYKDQINVVDQIVEIDRKVDVPVYYEASTGQRVANYTVGQQVEIIEEVEEVPYNVYVDKIREVVVEQEYEVIREEDNIIVKRVPVERVVVNTEYYDEIREVEVPVEVEKIVEVTEEVYVDKYVDKEVIREVEKKVPVPKHVEVIVTRVIDVPVIRDIIVEVPYEKIVVNKTETVAEVMFVEPRVQMVDIDVPRVIEQDVQEDLEIEFDVEKIVEREVKTETQVPVDYTRQVVRTHSRRESYNKDVELVKTVQKPNVRSSYRDINVAVKVQKKITTTNPVIQQNVERLTKDKQVDVIETNELVQYNEIVENVELKTESSKTRMTRGQKTDLSQISSETSRVQLSNLKMRTDIENYEQYIADIRSVIIDEESLNQNRLELTEKLSKLDILIQGCTTETSQIETDIRFADSQVLTEDVEVYTATEIARIEAQIKEVEERNQKLREVLGKVDIRSSRVGEMSAVKVVEGMKISRQVEAILQGYERDPNATITSSGGKMVKSVYVEGQRSTGNNVNRTTTTTNTTTTRTNNNTYGGARQNVTYTSSQQGSRTGSQQGSRTGSQQRGQQGSQQGSRTVSQQGSRNVSQSGPQVVSSSTNQSGQVTRYGQGTSTGASRGYTSGTTTQNRTVTQTYQSSSSRGNQNNGGLVSGNTHTETTTSYTNSSHPERNYSNKTVTDVPSNYITGRHEVRGSKVIKESPGEYVQSNSLVSSQNRQKLFNSRGGQTGGNQGKLSFSV